MDAFDPRFAADQGIVIGMSRRADGDMRLRSQGLVQDDLLRRRQAFLGRQQSGASIAAPLSVHGAGVAVVTSRESRHLGHALFPDTDALVTDRPGILLTATAADCLPVAFHDPARGVIGLAHAGWRGLVAPAGGVLGATVRALVGLGAAPEQLRAAVGPSIGPCHYPVGEEVRERFRAADLAAAVQGEVIDLRMAARLLLERSGVAADRIFADPPCTVCHAAHWFSRRADGVDPPQTGMAWLLLV